MTLLKHWPLVSLALSIVSLAARDDLAFILVGDSTTANTTTVNSGGWGNGFCNSLQNSFATPCINTAHNGATTGSFVADGFWNISIANVKEQVAAGKRTFVTIQFGHNDQKIAPPESMGANMTEMITELRVLGAEPVLVTSLTRRTFLSNGSIDNALADWAAETRLVASQQGTHLLDLNVASIQYCEAIGPDLSHVLNRTPDDDTHLNENGTIIFGRILNELFNASYPNLLPIVPIPGFPDLDSDIEAGIAVFH